MKLFQRSRLRSHCDYSSAIARNRANLGIVVSAFVYDTAIRHPGGPIDPAGYLKIHVHVKETSRQAWMKIIDPAAPLTAVCLASQHRLTATAPPRTQRLPYLLGTREGSCPATGPTHCALRLTPVVEAIGRCYGAAWASISFRSSGQDWAKAGCSG